MRYPSGEFPRRLACVEQRSAPCRLRSAMSGPKARMRRRSAAELTARNQPCRTVPLTGLHQSGQYLPGLRTAAQPGPTSHTIRPRGLSALSPCGQITRQPCGRRRIQPCALRLGQNAPPHRSRAGWASGALSARRACVHPTAGATSATRASGSSMWHKDSSLRRCADDCMWSEPPWRSSGWAISPRPRSQTSASAWRQHCSAASEWTACAILAINGLQPASGCGPRLVSPPLSKPCRHSR